METLNDVLNYSKYYFGKNEPPVFHNEMVNIFEKVFVPIDDYAICNKLQLKGREEVILHYFVKDTCQNRLLLNNNADKKIHSKVYAVTSPDFSADSDNCYSCLNESNILKSRICAYRWQSELDERVLLTWLWSGPETYKWAFGNVEKGPVGVISAQGVKEWSVFEEGFKVGVDLIQPENLCWYGTIPLFVSKYYDLSRIIQMNSRTSLVKRIKTKNCENEKSLFNGD